LITTKAWCQCKLCILFVDTSNSEAVGNYT
jgi:hypothetical protein